MSHPVQQKASVGAKEFVAMLTLFVASNAFLSYPRYVSESGLEAAWMEPIGSAVLSLVLFLVVEKLLSRFFPGMDIVEVVKEKFGSFLATLVGIVFALYFVANTASVMRQFVENVVSTVLPTTPILVIGIFFIATVGYFAYTGLEGICRTAYLFLPVLVIGIIGLCLLTMNQWHRELLFPIWGSGIPAVLMGSFRYASIFTNVLLLCVIYPHAHDARAFRKIGVWSILISTTLLVAFLLVYHMVFGAIESGKSTFSLYQLARLIYLGSFLQRLESVFVFLWVISAVIKMAAMVWSAAYLLSSAFTWPTFRPAVPGISTLCFALGMWPRNLVDVIDFDQKYLMSWGWTVVFGLPVSIVVLGALMHKLRRTTGRRLNRA